MSLTSDPDVSIIGWFSQSICLLFGFSIINIGWNMVKHVDLTLTLCDLGYPWPLTLTFQGVVYSDKAYVFLGVYNINIGRNMVKNVDLTLALGELEWPWPLTLTFQGALHWYKTIVFCLSFYGQYRLKQKCKFDLDLGWPWMTLILTLTHMALILDLTHFCGTRWEKVNGFGLESIRSILEEKC